MAKPGAISSVSLQAASGGITVSWSAATYAESYMLQRQTYGESAWTTVKSEIADRTYTDAAVKAGTKYRYRVRAKNVSGYGAYKVSAYAVAASSSTVPGPISSVTATATSGKITVKWSAASNATMYMIQRRAYAGGAWGDWTTLKSNQTGTSYTDGTAAKGTKYQYRVRGRNSAVYGSYKSCSTVTAK
jgi:titin